MNEVDEAEVMSKAHVSLDDRSYDIHIGRNLIGNINEMIPFSLDGRKVFILTDDNIEDTHGATILAALENSEAASVQMLSLKPGEQTKSVAHLFEVTNWLLDNQADRQSVLFTVGGGVIGDLGGFAASITLRGIPYIQVPTTLLAQVDSSVGGKTAIDMPQGKNLVGTFYQPQAVICDLDVLRTLPLRELKAGYAEIVKYALINDESFFLWLEGRAQGILKGDVETLARSIEIACRKKSEIVSQDEKEGNIRALLNLGHTFGHALEAYCKYDGRILHGEAVAIGIVCAFRLSVRLGHCSEADAARIEKHFETMGLPSKILDIKPAIKATSKQLIDLMGSDKKVFQGKVTFILTRGIGKAYTTREVNLHDVERIIEHSMED